ncbi:hypothetical protein JCM6882_009041 [Rhodosporidiobolus microsporus]
MSWNYGNGYQQMPNYEYANLSDLENEAAPTYPPPGYAVQQSAAPQYPSPAYSANPVPESASHDQNVLAYIEYHRLADNPVLLACQTMERTFYAVVALMDVEWRSMHCTPYAANEIAFRPKHTTSHYDLWLQYFYIVVEATFLRKLDEPQRSERLTMAGSVGLGNFGSRSALPALPLSARRGLGLYSGVRADTGIDNDLNTWDYGSLPSSPPEHGLYLDRFTGATEPCKSGEVWWQWAGARSALHTSTDGQEAASPSYADHFLRQHTVSDAAFPATRYRALPSLSIIFCGPRQQGSQERSRPGPSSPVFPSRRRRSGR